MHDTEKTYMFMENIFKLVEVLAVTERDIQVAFQQRWKDFEDCVQFVTAKNNHVDYIITVNHKDFEDVTLPVLSPGACVELL
jgi:predicted nucleic acid-binding protein